MKFKKLAAAFLAVLMVAMFIPSVASAATTSISTSAFVNGRQYRLTNMPANHPTSAKITYNGKTVDGKAIQNFAESPDGKYIFSIAEVLISGNNSSMICVFNKPSKTGASVETECFDSELLNNYGHSDSIAVTQPNSSKQIYYIYVGCTPNKSESKRYPTEAMRLTYDATQKKITKKVKIAGLKYCTSYNKAKRTAVAANQKANRIGFYIVTSGNGDHYVIYDLKKLNAKLDKIKNGGSYNIKNASSLKVATVKHNFSSSYQSFDLDGKYIYIGGGSKGDGGVIEKVAYKSSKSVQDKGTSKTIKIPSPKIVLKGGTTSGTFTKSNLEFEGVKVSSTSGYLLCSFTIDGQAKHDSVVVTRIKA